MGFIQTRPERILMPEDYGVDECKRCSRLVESRSQIVDGVGRGEAGALFVGEAPGRDEDRVGEPFVGRSGEVLTDKLRSVGLRRGEVRITNSVRCRPPDNRDPRKGELANCRPYLLEEIRFYDPRVVCTLGRVASTNLLRVDEPMRELVGDEREVKVEDTVYSVVPCYHPAAMLYDRGKEQEIDAVLRKVAGMTRP